MPVGRQFVQPVTHSMQVMRSRSGCGQAIPVRAKTMQQGKDNEEQEGKPDTVRSQRLHQDRKRCIHLTDLLYEAL